ncbi:MAG: hypothetical protein H0X63_07510 [Flavobacteriales bacterium]|jgi:hypothetical protein|nr:hypothetical protein [Flavobacteriales bacterium]
MNYSILFISFLLLTFSCSDKNYRNSNIAEKSQTDTISVEYYNNNHARIKEIKLRNGTIEKFYNNGNLFLRGQLDKGNQRIGKWNYYTKDGKLSETREYYVIDKRPYLNQNIYFSKDDEYWTTIKDDNFNVYDQKEFYGDTLYHNISYFAEFDLGKDTININEPWRAVCYYYTPVFKDKNSEAIVVMGRTEHNYNKDFSNIQEIKTDTFYSLQKNVKNQRYFPDDDPNYTVVFGKWFKTPGKKILRGYLSENYKDNTDGYKEKRIFFEKSIYVKDN